MKFRKEILVAVLGTAFAVGTSGCSVMHELQPHRLWKWNHGTGGMSPDDYSDFRSDAAGSTKFMASVADDSPESPSDECRTTNGE